MNYLDTLRRKNSALNEFTDDAIIQALPEYSPNIFGNLPAEEVKALALQDNNALADLGRTFWSGVKSAASSTVTGAEQWAGADWSLDERLQESADRTMAKVDPLLREQIAQAGFREDSKNTPMGLVGAGVQSLGSLGVFAPVMAASALAAPLTGGASVPAGIAVIGGGVVNALLVGGGSYEETRESIEALTEEDLADSPLFAAYLEDEEQYDTEGAFDRARARMAESLASDALKQGTAIGGTSGLAVGPMLNRVFRGGGGMIAGARTGAITEGVQELGESGGEALAREVALSEATGRPVDWDLVGRDAAFGALMGAGAGGSLGGAAGLLTPRRNPMEEAEDKIRQAGEEALARGGDELDAEIARARTAVEEIPKATAAQASLETIRAPEQAITGADLGIQPLTPFDTVQAPDQTATAADLGIAYPDAAVSLGPERIPLDQPRDMTGLDGLITVADRMGFTDEVARLTTAKRLYAAADRLQNEGNADMAARYRERADGIYRAVTEPPESPVREYANQFPAPYEFQGQVEGGEVGPSLRQGFTMRDPAEDIEGSAIGVPTNLLEDQGRRLTDEGIIYAQAPAAEATADVDPRVGRNIVDRMARRPAGIGVDPGYQARQISPQLIMRTDNTPFPSEDVARIAARARRLADHAPVPVEGGWALAPEAQADIRGEPVDQEWASFSPESGTLGIPRAEMPQIQAEHRGAMVNFMNARGVQHREETVPATSLKPTQAEYSEAKVQGAKDFKGGDRAILVSADNHVLDGHHQWMAARDAGDDVRIIRLNAPIRELVDLAHEFPSSTTDTASTASETQSPEPVSLASLEQARAERVKQERQRARRRIKPDDSLVTAAIKLGGLKTEWRQDITGDTKGNRNVPGVGALFSDKTGTSPDDMAMKLWEAGYITEDQLQDLDARDFLYSAIADELAGRKTTYALNSERAQLAELEALEEQYQAELEDLQEDREAAYQAIEAEYGKEVADLARHYDEGGEQYVDAQEQDAEHYEQQDQERREILSADAERDADAPRATRDDRVRQDAEEARARQAAEDRASQADGGARRTARPVTSEPSDEGFSLSSETEQSRRQRESRAQDTTLETRAQVDREREHFGLEQPGGNASGVGMGGGQSDLLSTPPAAEARREPPTPPSPAEPAPIEDFGETLEGARKHLDAVRARLAGLGDDEIAKSTLSELWPKSEIDKIESPAAAALYHAIREVIPTKPRAKYKLKRWVESVKAARSLVDRVEEMGADALMQEMRKRSSGMADFADKVDLLASLDRASWSRIGTVTRQEGRYQDESGEMVPGSWYRVSIDGRIKVYQGKDAVSSLIEDVKADLAQDNSRPSDRFEIRQSRQSGRVFVNRKGDREQRALAEFDTAAEAITYLQQNAEALDAEWERVKERDNVGKGDLRRKENAERVGEDRRQGRDVTAEEFSETFGFRGIQFGNWVQQGRGSQDRQGMLNQAYDALLDLAEIIGIPPKAVSLNGELGLAFGARGGGRASAHYEPGTVVINLTKTKGAGSLAHEWFHALDHYFQRRRSIDADEPFITYQPENYYRDKKTGVRLPVSEFEPMARGEVSPQGKRFISSRFNRADWELVEGVRPQVADAFAALVEALDASPMSKRARTIDKGREDGYWSRIIERAARSFESYVIARMAELGKSNDFLANVVSIDEFKRNPDRYPYLLDSEIKPVAEAFDHLFETIEARETDQGVELFSADDSPASSGHTMDSLRTAMEEAFPGVVSSLENAGLARIVTSDQVPAQLRRRTRGGERIHSKAYVQGNTATFIADNIDSEADVKGLLLHEIGVHLKRLGREDAEFQRILRQFERLRDLGGAKVRAAFDRVPDDTPAHLVTEEALGYYVEANPELSLAQKVIAWFRAKLREWLGEAKGLDRARLMSWGNSLTEADFVYMAQAATRDTTRQADSRATDAVAFSAEEASFDQPANYAFTESEYRPEVVSWAKERFGDQEASNGKPAWQNFVRWFGDSKVVDADGRPLVVYHGTAADFDAFDNAKTGLHDNGLWGRGHYFSANLDNANSYALRQGDGARLVPAYISIQNPLVLRTGSDLVTRLPDGTNTRELIGPNLDGSKIKGIAVEGGHDGVIQYKPDGSIGDLVAFRPEQIKSATGNRGTFDSADPDIRFSADAAVRPPFRPRKAEGVDPYAEENRRLREQDKTLWARAKQILRRGFAPGGLLPSQVFNEKIRRDSNFQAIEFDVRHLNGTLEQAIKKDYGVRADKLSEDKLAVLAEALAGRVDDSIPQATKEAIVAMRQYIDTLSGEYLGIIQGKINALIERAQESNRDSDRAAAINEIELYEKIKGNIGQYVHRSYRAFDDEKWFRKVPTATVNAARIYLEQGYREQGETAAEARRLADVAINEILKNGTAYDSMEQFITEGKLGAKDLSVLMRRKEVPKAIRDLLGEYRDPRMNFTKSATKMGRLIWNERFLSRVRDMGMGTFLFEGKNRPAAATAQIAAEGSSVMAPLNGLWTFPDVAQSFEDALGKEKMSDLYRTVVRLNGMVKVGKTVLSPTTAMRNWQSALFFSLANGHFDLTQMRHSIAAFREQVMQNADGEQLAYLRRLKELGVVYDTPYAGELRRYLEDSKLEDWLEGKKSAPALAMRKLSQMAQGFYTFGDDFWKIIGFENEKASLRKAGFSESQAETMAAERIRNTYPTYSMVGRSIKWLSRFPLMGTFVSFPAEIVRTSVNMLQLTASDLRSDNPGLRMLGIKRAVGMSFVSAGFYALSAFTAAALGVDDEEEEALRDLSAPWQKNSTFLYTGRDANGNLRYFDMSFLDPYGYWKRPLTAMMRDQPWEDAAVSALRDMLDPFFGTDIATGAIFEVLSNKKASGGRVYSPSGDPVDQTLDIANHLRKALQPGFMGNAERIWLAGQGARREGSGQPYDMRDELVALLGWRASSLDAKTALYYRSFEFTDALSEARRTLTRTLRSSNRVSDSDIRSARESAQGQYEKAFMEMDRLVKAARAAGMSNQAIAEILRLSGISRQNVMSLMAGRIPPMHIGTQSLDRAVRQARVLQGPEHAQEVADRFRRATAE